MIGSNPVAGLKLDRVRGTVDVILVDHVERPTES
jgi:hypothetical protein